MLLFAITIININSITTTIWCLEAVNSMLYVLFIKHYLIALISFYFSVVAQTYLWKCDTTVNGSDTEGVLAFVETDQLIKTSSDCSGRYHATTR